MSDNRNTLISKYEEKLRCFQKERDIELPKYEKQLKSITKKMVVHKKNNPTNTPEYWEIYWDMHDLKTWIEEEIKRISDPTIEIEYVLDVLPLLSEYLDEEQRSINSPFAGAPKTTDDLEEDDRDAEGTATSSAPRSYTGTLLDSKFVNITGSISKGDLYNQYLLRIENDASGVKIQKDAEFTICRNCPAGEMQIDVDECTAVCKSCGFVKQFVESTLKHASYQQDIEITNYIAYKRINHFNEWLSQFQGTESTVVPSHVFEQLAGEFKKIRVTKTDNIKPEKIREFLKKLKLNKFYEHIPYILRIMQGKSPPSLTNKMEEILRAMFRDIQEPFERACPPQRKNFLSYSYVLHKFCELLEYDEFIESFSLLKSREKLYQQDVIWKKICKELRWQFIPSL